MDSLIDRIKKKITDLLKINQNLERRVRDLSHENHHLIQEQSLRETERLKVEGELENILSSLEEATGEMKEEEELDGGVFQKAQPAITLSCSQNSPSIAKKKFIYF